MNSQSKSVTSQIKLEAKELYLAAQLAIQPTDCINQLEPSLKAPSLQQCNEIIAHAYGFNTYNGVTTLNGTFSTKKRNQSLRLTLLKNNLSNESSGLYTITGMALGDLIEDKKLDSIIENINQNLLLICAFPSLLKFNIPKRFASKEYIFDWETIDKSRSHSESVFRSVSMESAFHLALSLIIENLDKIQVFNQDDTSVVMVVPVSIFYKHEVTDIYQVTDIRIDLEDLLDSTDIIKILSVEFDFLDHKNSKLNIRIPLSYSEQIKMIFKLLKAQDSAISKLDSVLDVYVNHYNTAFSTIFDFACMSKSPDKRLTGIDTVKYQLNKYLFSVVLFNVLKIKNTEIYATSTEVLDCCNLKHLDNKFMPESAYINDAITIFDEKYARVVLPFINEYVKQQAALIKEIKPYIENISATGSDAIPVDLQRKLIDTNSKITDSLSRTMLVLM